MLGLLNGFTTAFLHLVSIKSIAGFVVVALYLK